MSYPSLQPDLLHLFIHACYTALLRPNESKGTDWWALFQMSLLLSCLLVSLLLSGLPAMPRQQNAGIQAPSQRGLGITMAGRAVVQLWPGQWALGKAALLCGIRVCGTVCVWAIAGIVQARQYSAICEAVPVFLPIHSSDSWSQSCITCYFLLTVIYLFQTVRLERAQP